MDRSTVISVKVSEQLKSDVKTIAVELDRSLNYICVKAIEEYVNKYFNRK